MSNKFETADRKYFMETERIGFSKWEKTDTALAFMLWGDAKVSKYISAGGVFTRKQIEQRLLTEIENDKRCRIQYWPIFVREAYREAPKGPLPEAGGFIGCCGLRPWEDSREVLEMGVHLRSAFWGRGYAQEAARAVIRYAFSTVGAVRVQAGHHPENLASQKLLVKLGFQFEEERFYAPTGLWHPTYYMTEGQSGKF